LGKEEPEMKLWTQPNGSTQNTLLGRDLDDVEKTMVIQLSGKGTGGSKPDPWGSQNCILVVRGLVFVTNARSNTVSVVDPVLEKEVAS
jgi:DNA-binding beta-propeller fold protein YncE